jgi:hypothetical protein
MAARVQSSSAATPEAEAAPLRQAGRVYPKVGVIDGGVGDQLNPWKLGSHTRVQTDKTTYRNSENSRRHLELIRKRRMKTV